MSTEQLPDGLQLAVNVLLEESARNELIGAPESWNAEPGGAIATIRAEHAQRLTLQHHAADMAQRVADLEAERNKLAHEHHLVRADAQARVDAAVIRALSAEKERDELRHRADIAEQRCGVLIDADEPRTEQLRAACRERDELRARLDALEQQEVDGWVVLTPNGSRLVSEQEAKGRPQAYPLYARPVPAQAVPDGWRLVTVEPTPEMIDTATAGDEAYSLRSFGPGAFVCQGGEDHWAAMIDAAPGAAR